MDTGGKAFSKKKALIEKLSLDPTAGDVIHDLPYIFCR